MPQADAPRGAEGDDRLWNVSVYGFGTLRVVAPTAGAARYRNWRKANEAGYFTGRDGFYRFMLDSRVWPAERSA